MRAIPAGIFDVPTPKFLITVGNNSAVYRGIITFDEDTENLPAMTNDSEIHSSVSRDKNVFFQTVLRIKKVKKITRNTWW